MTDTTVTTAAPADTESKRESVAKHELIAAAGGAHTDIATATGIRYTDKASGNVFEYLIPGAQAGTPLTMFALFGAKTKATNETSRVRNGTGGDTTAQMEALDEVFESITNGVWREKAEGGGGSRTDKDLLATILIEQLGTQAKGDVAFYVKRMADEKGYIRKVLSNDSIKDEYRKRAGKVSVAIDTLA
jgi:hypothetical protein